jgi:hypothetical protein
MPVEVPEDIAAELMLKGRRPIERKSEERE